MTAEYANIQRLLSNCSEKKNVSTAKTGYNNNENSNRNEWNNGTATEEWGFLCGPCRDVLSRTVSESVELG
jgi:hypothetical protein